MASINITIKNLPQIKAAFGKSPILMARELNLAIERSVMKISQSSRSNTPVDTGELRSSTYTRYGNLSGEVGTNTEYDTFVHEGTRYMKARPYLRKAVTQNSSTVNDYFGKAVQNVLDKIGNSV